MKKYFLFVTAGLSLIFVAGCTEVANHPNLTPLEIQSLQTRDYPNEKEVVFSSVVSVFQDLGYTINNADLDTGLITAESAAQNNPGTTFWFGYTEVKQTRATGFIERINDQTRVRLNFVETTQTDSTYGQSDRTDAPILDSDLYLNAFEKVEQAIFIRS